jgi:uncharacterized membrane protein YdjX (TVP38/TMEM64 family)
MVEFLDKILGLYFSFEYILNDNFYKFMIGFIIISTTWVSLIGIITPILLVSALAFGYYGIIVSLFVLILGSITSYIIAKKSTRIIVRNKKLKQNNFRDPLLTYVIFRLAPGIPYIVKNLSVVFFKLNLKRFFLAVIISDTPQILIFTVFFKKLFESSNSFFVHQNYNIIFEEMYLPLMCLFIFFVFIFILRKKRAKF